MTTLKEFEDALREQGMLMALAVLETLRAKDRARRPPASAPRRVAGRKMTPISLAASSNCTPIRR